MSQHFHGLDSFDDNEYRPFKRGELKKFKQRLNQHGKESGNEEMAKKMWRRGNAPPEKRDKKS